MIKELYKLAVETRKALNESEKIYVRVEGYPLTEPYTFYVKRETINEKIRDKINELFNIIVSICDKHTKK